MKASRLTALSVLMAALLIGLVASPPAPRRPGTS